MLKVRHLPKEPFILACSGGPDSMAALHFFKRSSKNVTALYINHGTSAAGAAENLVRGFCEKTKTPFMVASISDTKDKALSQEEFWRNERYKVFHAQNCPVVTGHHLGDSVETWIFSSLHGQGKIIPYRNQNVVRPFLLTKKEDFLDYCERHNVPFVTDPSNLDTAFMRNKIRHQVMPLALEVNPGLFKVVRKKVLSMLDDPSISEKLENISCKKTKLGVKITP